MSRELITDWSTYQASFDQLLGRAKHQLLIYDEDLSQLRLDLPSRLEQLKRLLGDLQPNSIRIALRNAEPLRRQQSHMIQFLATHSHIITIQETNPQLGNLRDAMVLVDNQHGLIRFDREQVRSKLLQDEADDIRPYLLRFDEIWKERGNVLSATTLGL
ncbi:MAG: hypothetical protein PHV02_12320 [Rhodocyclaceae bacterium]|nr:hypothetical protein [Rhodocyclaceae bacterium]